MVSATERELDFEPVDGWGPLSTSQPRRGHPGQYGTNLAASLATSRPHPQLESAHTLHILSRHSQQNVANTGYKKHEENNVLDKIPFLSLTRQRWRGRRPQTSGQRLPEAAQ